MGRVFVIAEAGVNHNGDERLALQLVDAAARCQADAVKFQTFKADKLVRRGADKAEYQKRTTGAGDQYSMLKVLEISEALHRRLVGRCNEVGIEFMSTPFDEESADFLVDLGIKRIKIPSGELTNHPFLAHLAAKNLPLILSTGMSTLEEIQEAVEVIRAAREQRGLSGQLSDVLTILHCTSNYPTALENVNLRAIPTLIDTLHLPVGYSDHTEGIMVSVAAVAAGAVVIEKHFTLDRGLPGPDHTASLEPGELAELVARVREIERAMGSGLKRPTESELAVRELVRRSVTLVRRVRGGQMITRDDLALLRPGNGIPPKQLEIVIGRRAARDIEEGTTLQWSDLV
ncbi:N-acetylneuraminate synthase [Sulfuritortus calidifontis]|uniref:N-acetylneuraminate synthase n=1 Tax=Sulfuritortus calidifontis TaxID=1914471 RepID=A0A4R3JWH3_9PROT|nr:N-acetylneuraminate synthase [Sulfuritortus calidifontis]TCS72475.1 N-acetylneuraminate synthase [Sulfuritortus calidifontis]